ELAEHIKTPIEQSPVFGRSRVRKYLPRPRKTLLKLRLAVQRRKEMPRLVEPPHLREHETGCEFQRRSHPGQSDRSRIRSRRTKELERLRRMPGQVLEDGEQVLATLVPHDTRRQ